MMIPTEINLHKKSRLLRIAFSDGQVFELPCEYLRVYSPDQQEIALNKEKVNIEQIEPQGHYAIRIIFDDGHDTGIYSWETLYELGKNYQQNWQAYLDKLKALGHERRSDEQDKLRLTILYFNYLVPKLRREREEIELPKDKAKDVQTLLKTLMRRKLERGYLLDPEHVRVTVNRQFAEPFTRLEDGDEIGIVPNSPTPPPPPKN